MERCRNYCRSYDARSYPLSGRDSIENECIAGILKREKCDIDDVQSSCKSEV